jgi:uncharacterized damage-inducible protein DinB
MAVYAGMLPGSPRGAVAAAVLAPGKGRDPSSQPCYDVILLPHYTVLFPVPRRRSGSLNWTNLLKSEMDQIYGATEGLIDLVDDDRLDWKPATGTNWMTTGQLLMHITNACGMTVSGFVTGDWGLPEGVNPEDMPAEDMLPPAEKLPTVSSVAEAKKLLAEDKLRAHRLIEEAGENRLANEASTAPWDPTPMPLGQRLLGMVGHLENHKGQLFYYLKLQGKPVNTMTLYGMGVPT